MKLILSKTIYGAIEGTLFELKGRFKEGEHIIIVPDRYSMAMEKKVLEFLGISSSFNIEVVSFNRLYKKLIKGERISCLTPEGAVMLLKRVIDKHKNELKYFGKVAKKMSFAREMYATLTELRNSGITSKMLKEKIGGGFKDNVDDISLLLDNYESALGGDFIDSTTRLNILTDYITKHEFTQNFYICGFSSFKAPEFNIVKALAEKSNSLTVGLVSGKGNKNARIYPNSLERSLSSFSNVEIKWYNLPLDKQSEMIAEHLFAYDTVKSVKGDKFDIIKANSLFEEVKFVSLDILKNIRGGKRYRDYVVVIPGVKEYGNIIENTFKRYQIPYFIDRPYLLTDTVLFKYLKALVELKLSNNRLEEALNFIKNPLFLKEPFNFENYCLKYSIEYIPSKEFSLGEFAEPEEVRKEIFFRLKGLPTEGDKDKFLTSFKNILDSIFINDKANEIKNISKENNDILNVSYHKLCEVLEEAGRILGDEEMTIEEFFEIYSSSLSQLTFSLLPLYIDSVIVYEAGNSKLWGIDNLYVLGATEGKYPVLRDSGMILTVQMEEKLSDDNMNFVTSAKFKNRENMLNVVDMLVSVKDKVKIVYPLMGKDKCATSSANIVFELKRFFNLEEKSFDDIERGIYKKGDLREISLRYLTNDACFNEIAENVTLNINEEDNKLLLYNTLYDNQKEFLASAYSLLDMDCKDKIDINKIENLSKKQDIKSSSVSRLEKFYSCPYSYYFAYVLGLKKREENEIMTMETGTIIHSVLENYFSLKNEIEDPVEFVKKQFDRILLDDRYKSMFKSPSGEITKKRLIKECVKLVEDLGDISMRSDFSPKYVEADFSDDGVFSPIKIDTKNGEVKLRGKIDRVDVYKDYAMVIDYKTFKSADLSFQDVYYGKKVQLFTYLKALTDYEHYKPAGVFYLPLYDTYNSKDISRYVLKGKAIKDVNVISHIDNAFEDRKVSTIEAAVKKDGTLKDSPKLMTDDEFKSVMNYVYEVDKKGIEYIQEGYIKASPVEKGCDFCDFANICKYKGDKKIERKLQNIGIGQLVSDDEMDK